MKTITITFALILSVCLPFVGFGQDTISRINLELEPLFQNNQAISLSNPSTGGFTILINDYSKVHVYEFNSLGKVTGNKQISKPTRSLVHMLECSRLDGNITVLFANASKSKFSSLLINESSQIPVSIDFQEKFMQCFNYNGKIFLMGVLKNSSILSFYEIDGKTKPIVHSIDLSKFRFSLDKDYKLSSVLPKNDVSENMMTVEKMSQGVINPFELMIARNKLFIMQGKLYLTLDNNSSFSIIIDIDLNDFSARVNSIPHQKVVCEFGYDDITNSFLYNGYLYQVLFCNKNIYFQITKLENKEVIRKYLINSDNFDSFRNSTIIKSSILTNNTEKFEESNVALKKIFYGTPGIAVVKSNDQYIVGIGSFNDIEMSNSTYNNPGFSYHNEWVKYFKTTLDSNFDHHNLANISDIYNETIEFIAEKGKKNISEVLVPVGKNYIYGFYNKKEQQYDLILFKHSN